MEFVLERGKPEKTVAMKVGSDRHAQLEQEVSQHFWFFQAECCAFSTMISPWKFLRTNLISTCFLLDQVVERVDVAIRSAEELWAVKFINFIVGTNQLMFEGMTREIPV